MIADSIVNSPGNKSLLDEELNKFFTKNVNNAFDNTRPVETNDDDDDDEAIYLKFDEATGEAIDPPEFITADEREEGVYYYTKGTNESPKTSGGKVYIP